jgi:anti-anti-sigma regulatory factor
MAGAPDRPIVLSFDEVTGMDAGGIDALRASARKAHEMGVILTLLVPATEVLENLRAGGFDENPQILLEVLDT